MVISIVANVYYTDTCNQTPPTNMPGTGNEKDTNHQFFYFYNSKHDLTSEVVEFTTEGQNKPEKHAHSQSLYSYYTINPLLISLSFNQLRGK